MTASGSISRIHTNKGRDMTPEQIQAMVKGAVEASGGPAWWVYALLIICACLGSYFGSYLGEKGKNTATKEDIEAITAKVEAVKQSLASRGWVRQQQWVNREKHYLQILTHLSVMRTQLAELYSEAKRKQEATEETSAFIDAPKVLEDYIEHKGKLLELLGPASVFVPAPTVEVIYAHFAREMRAPDVFDDPVECFGDLVISISNAFKSVLESAQTDLREAEEAAGAPQ
jgi:hypothetical protein